MTVDVSELRDIASKRDRYKSQLARLQNAKKQTSCIEAAVSSASETLESGTSSFVIYGEPQSGKTEMMICLTAKLLDDGHHVIIHLLNDSVQLLQQNLDRFQRSNLSPAARNFSDVIDPDYSLATGFHVIFCKKNASDLAKLNQKLERVARKVIIDDEADFATPNALINKGDATRINALIKQLINDDGIYIGVTATPARLDLNNTFDNDNEKWVNFPPHDAYTGQDVFFPLDTNPEFSLQPIPDTDDSPKYLREAIFRFLVRVAALNLAAGNDENFSMLIHTSGKKLDHKSDKKPIDDVMNALSDVHSKKFESYTQELDKIATRLYGPSQTSRILGYIVRNCDQTTTVIMNSRPHRHYDQAPLKPFDGFTVSVKNALKCVVERKTENAKWATASVRLGDARKLRVDTDSIDLVITSPPYLNAIDYIRCSKFSLVWMGHQIDGLRELRAKSVGTEVGIDHENNAKLSRIIRSLEVPDLPKRKQAILAAYIEDMRKAISEVARVLAPGGRAIYVIGENMIQGNFIKTSKVLSLLAKNAGLRVTSAEERVLPPNRRYLPPPTHGSLTMDTRMRTEVILHFAKPKKRSDKRRLA